MAVVLARSGDYGLQRMMQGFSDDWLGVMELALFFSIDEARDWVRQFPAPQPR